MNDTTFFVSDIHFGLESAQREKTKETRFVEFLKYCAENTSRLFILGDLFDYWFEYRRVVQKGYFRTFNYIYELTSNGTEVNFIIGNHDFMHRNYFESDLGVRILPDEYSCELGGRKFFLAHGDGMVPNDKGYKMLKKVIRNKKIQNLYSFLHPDFGVWLAGLTSRKSRNYTGEKDYGEQDGLADSAKKLIEKGYDYVLFGHSHRRVNAVYQTGKYINLGSWLDSPCYAKFDGSDLKIIDW